MTKVFSLIVDGGIFFMLPIVLLLILIIILIVRELIAKSNYKKTISLVASLSLFTLAWGFLGQTIGLIAGFDAIEQIDNISASILAGGLKISFLPSVFGLVSFLIGRLGIIILTWLRHEEV